MIVRAARRPGEFELIARHFAPLSAGFPGAFGLRDDAAVIGPRAGHELVAKTDAIVCGVHFRASDPAADIARKALRVNLSDLAAKGAVPRAYLLDLVLPANAGSEWIAAFARGLARDQREFGVRLIGGDTDETPGVATIAITALGEVPVGGMIRRAGARPGDALFVTGTLGDAALALDAARGALPRLGTADARFLASRYRLPRPRVALGPRLRGIATAAIDISDGLLADLGHLCDVSRVDATAHAALLPLSPAARRAAAMLDGTLARIVGGGDDYEILFTAPVSARASLARLARTFGVRVTEIGAIEAKRHAAPAVRLLDTAGRPIDVGRAGWTHFARGA